MGRSRMQRKSVRADEDGGNGYEYPCSSSSETQWSDGNPNKAVEVQTIFGLERSLEALYEKRAAAMGAGLQGLIESLSQDVLRGNVANQYETLVDRILTCMKKGGSLEMALGARALGLLVLTLGPGDKSLRVKEEAEECLREAAIVAHSSNARGAALNAVAIVNLVCDSAEDTKDAMAFLWQTICYAPNDSDQESRLLEPTDSVTVAALAGWTLLLSILPSNLISGTLLVSSLPVLSALLQSPDPAVRKAAGEAAATLNEAARNCSGAGNGNWNGESLLGDVEEDGEPPLNESENVKDVTTAHVMQEALLEMKKLSVGNRKGVLPRKERAPQRNSFRQLLRTLNGGPPREVKVEVQNGEVLIIDNWNDIVKLNWLKHYLGDSGLQAHMQGNDFLREMFGVELVEKREKRVRVCDLNLSKTEKKKMYSPNSKSSKARTKHLNRTRLKSQVDKATSFNVNGYESD